MDKIDLTKNFYYILEVGIFISNHTYNISLKHQTKCGKSLGKVTFIDLDVIEIRSFKNL